MKFVVARNILLDLAFVTLQGTAVYLSCGPTVRFYGFLGIVARMPLSYAKQGQHGHLNLLLHLLLGLLSCIGIVDTVSSTNYLRDLDPRYLSLKLGHYYQIEEQKDYCVEARV